MLRLIFRLSGYVIALSVVCGAQVRAEVKVVETPVATLRLNAATCDLVGVHWTSPALDVIAEPKLGENFRILLPKPGMEANYFNSRDQRVATIDATPDGVTCRYASLKNQLEEVPLAVTYRMRVEGGQLRFSIEVDNPTDRKLAEVYYGILGGLQGVGNRADTQTLVPGPTDNLAPAMFTRWKSGARGGTRFGARYEVAGYSYPQAMPMGWMDAYNTHAGVGYYYGLQDAETRVSTLYFEMRPYAKGATIGGDWPEASELPPGEPVGVTMGWLNFPYTSKGKFTAGPVALQVHAGDWHAASAIYRTWFDQHFNVKRPATWLRKENAWQSIILSGPEDTVAHRFSELPKLAADAKKYGITTFEILGWQIGGLDRGYPLYTPDPKLGTADEFRKALAEMRAMGVHPLIFNNVQVVDTALPIFRERFAKYAVHGKWAPDWEVEGWGEGTMGARLGFAGSNMTAVSPWHKEFHDYLMHDFMQSVRDGADGFQMDKTHTTGLDFNPLLPVSPDKSLEAGTFKLFEEVLHEARKIKPDFAIAAEAWTDRAFPYVDVSYMRENGVDLGSAALRYTFPEWTSTIFAEQGGDYALMNNGMRYGLVWDLAPRHYNESVDEPTMRSLSRYVAELIRIRKQYADLLFLGRFNDTMGAEMTTEARGMRYSVFKSTDAASGDMAAVVVNFGAEAQTATLSIPGKAGRTVEVVMPFEPSRNVVLPATLTVPAGRLAVVVLREGGAK